MLAAALQALCSAAGGPRGGKFAPADPCNPLHPAAGDLGRTRPSLGDLLGCQAEIVSLDVTEIHMAFGDEAQAQ